MIILLLTLSMALKHLGTFHILLVTLLFFIPILVEAVLSYNCSDSKFGPNDPRAQRLRQNIDGAITSLRQKQSRGEMVEQSDGSDLAIQAVDASWDSDNTFEAIMVCRAGRVTYCVACVRYTFVELLDYLCVGYIGATAMGGNVDTLDPVCWVSYGLRLHSPPPPPPTDDSCPNPIQSLKKIF